MFEKKINFSVSCDSKLMKKIVAFLIIITLLWASESLAGDPKVFTDTDLKKYGGSNDSSADLNPCSVIDYDSYSTYLKVDIINYSAQERVVNTSRDIKVHTIKGNVLSPTNSETYYIKPGETKTISGLKFENPFSKIVSVECSCW
jgi:hypothetical protein